MPHPPEQPPTPRTATNHAATVAHIQEALVVAVLPYRSFGDGLEVLLTDEQVPSWPEAGVSAVTGRPEQSDPGMTAVRQLAGQCGFHVDRRSLVALGWCRAGKRSPTRYELFAVDVTGLEPGDRVGDGSEAATEDTGVWVPVAQSVQQRHALVHSMVLRLLAKLTNNSSGSAHHLVAHGPRTAATYRAGGDPGE